MKNKDLKNLTLEEAISLFRGMKEIPLYEELLRIIYATIGKPKLIREDYVLTKFDRNNVITSVESTALTVTLPLNLNFDDLDYIDFEKLGSGNLTISAPAGVSINGTDNPSAVISADVAGVRLRKTAENTYKLIGTAVIS